MKEINALYQATLQRIQELDTERNALQIKKATLEELGAGKPVRPARATAALSRPPAPASASSTAARAPKGSLPSAVLALYTGGEGWTAAQIREKLSGAGYPHALGAMHVRKVLKKMAREGALKSELLNGVSVFSKMIKVID